ADDTDNKNTQFRQTGLQSNEARFGGLTQFKAYGEMLDPDLSNIKIVTAGIGFRMASNAFLDLVYHRYGLDHFANEFRSAGVTAEMNKVETQLSKDVGSEINLIVGFRNLFGFRRFGFEVRAGVFSPGDAFLRNDGDAVNPIIVRADKASSILFVLIL
ncbi:MAG TPA: alginate export family protein, partial [Sulfuricaulis sp.]